jgi:hypothetical protein
MMIENNCREFLQGTDDAIAQVELATASDHVNVEMLTVTNSKLTTQIEEAQVYIKTLKQYSVDLKDKIKPTRQGHRPAKRMNNDTSWWSHGYQIHKDHTSAMCKAPKERHKTKATKSNTMCGVKWGKE